MSLREGKNNPSPQKGGRLGGGLTTRQFDHARSKTTRARNLRRNETDAEKLLWSKLRNDQLGVSFRRQYPIGNYILDFFCTVKRVAIELDGGQHTFSENQANDAKRDTWLAQRDIKVLRFWNNEVLQNVEGALETILSVLNSTPTLTLPLSGGGNIGEVDR